MSRILGRWSEYCGQLQFAESHFFEKGEDVARLYSEECQGGRILCGECKSRLIRIVVDFLKEHQRKRRRHVDKAREILGVE